MTATTRPVRAALRSPHHPRNRAEAVRMREQSLLLPKPGQPTHVREPNRVNPRLAIYDRRSFKTDTSASMARQHRENLAEVERLKGVFNPDEDAYFDDDISAKGGKLRPGMEALLRAVQAGRYDGVVAYELPRLLRNKLEALNFKAIMLNAACDIYTVRHAGLTLYGPMAGSFDLLVDYAASEVASTSERIASWHEQMSSLGVPRGASAPYGMAKAPSERFIDGRAKPLQTLVPDEEPRPELGGHSRAELIRQAAAELISGSSYRRIVRAWNDAGYPALKGGPWYVTSLKGVIRNPAIAGFATRGGKIVAADGGLWDAASAIEPLRPHTPVLDQKTWMELEHVRKSRPAQRRATNEALLRGLLTCGICGGRMVRSGSNNDYRCRRLNSAPGGDCCTGRTIAAAPLELFVIEAVCGLLDDEELLADARAQADPTAYKASLALEAKIAALDDALGQLELEWAKTTVRDRRSKARFQRNHGALESELKAASAELEELTLRTTRPNLAALRAELPVAEAFAALSQREQTTILGELIDDIVIGAWTLRGGSRFDVSRVTINWARS